MLIWSYVLDDLCFCFRGPKPHIRAKCHPSWLGLFHSSSSCLLTATSWLKGTLVICTPQVFCFKHNTSVTDWYSFLVLPKPQTFENRFCSLLITQPSYRLWKLGFSIKNVNLFRHDCNVRSRCHFSACYFVISTLWKNVLCASIWICS